MIGEIGNFKMKKGLLILFIIPAFIYGQDVPLTEKKVTTESMENKERKLKEKADDKVRKENTKRTKKYNRSLAMHPKNQIGLSYGISDFSYYGFNYHHYFTKNFGCYIHYENSLNVVENSLNVVDYPPVGSLKSLSGVSAGFEVFNLGSSLRFAGDGISDFETDANAWFYYGLGRSTEKLFDRYFNGEYVRNGEIHKFNLNIGILLQYSAGASWQVGFNSTLNLLYFGLGFSW
jgi:hypothetical protein